MESLREIESAAKRLPTSEPEKLVKSLTSNLRSTRRKIQAELCRFGSDLLLVAPDGAPAMTPQRVKQRLEESP